MTNNPNGFQREIKIKGQRLEEVENFKYLGAIISNEGSKSEILSRLIAALSRLKIISNEGSKPEILSRTTTALSRLKIILRRTSFLLLRTLILSNFLYACESSLTAETERMIQALEMRCYIRLLNISYKDHVKNEEVRNRIQNATAVHDDLLTMVKKRKLRCYGHFSFGRQFCKGQWGRQTKRREDNIKEWTGMGFGDCLRAAEDRKGWKGIVGTSSVVLRRPPRLRDWDERETGITAFLISVQQGCFYLIRLSQITV